MSAAVLPAFGCPGTTGDPVTLSAINNDGTDVAVLDTTANFDAFGDVGVLLIKGASLQGIKPACLPYEKVSSTQLKVRLPRTGYYTGNHTGLTAAKVWDTVVTNTSVSITAANVTGTTAVIETDSSDPQPWDRITFLKVTGMSGDDSAIADDTYAAKYLGGGKWEISGLSGATDGDHQFLTGTGEAPARQGAVQAEGVVAAAVSPTASGRPGAVVNTPIKMRELANLGDLAYLYIGGRQIVSRGTKTYAGGIQEPGKEMVFAQYDGQAVTRKTDLYTNDELDDHSPACQVAVPGSNTVIWAQTEHANAAAEDIRFYVSTTGDIADATLKHTHAGTKPTYIQMHLDGNRLFLLTRYGGNVLSEWKLIYIADITAGTWTPAETPLFVGSYVRTVAAKDGSGIHCTFFAPPNAPTGVGANDITNAMVWAPVWTYAFIRFSDDALLINGEVEVADVKAMANDLHMQCRNLLQYTDEFSTNWVRTAVSEFISSNATDRWGKSDLTSPATRGVYKLTATGGNTTHKIESQTTFSAKAGVTYTVSVYASNNSDISKLLLRGIGACIAGGITPYGKFDLSGSGSVHEVVGGSNVSAKIERAPEMGAGWFRTSLTFKAEVTVTNQFGITIAPQSDAWSSTFDQNNAGIHIQGAQLEVGTLTPYVAQPATNDAPTEQPPIMVEQPEGGTMWAVALEQIVDGYLECVWAELKGYSGVTSGNHTDCVYKYGRFNLTSFKMEDEEEIAMTGFGSGNQVNYIGFASIHGVRRVVFGQNDLNEAGTNYLKFWDGTHEYTLDESATHLLMRPEAVFKMDDANELKVDPRRLMYVRSTYPDTYTNFTEMEARLVELELQ